MNTVLKAFRINGEPVSCTRFGCGHINETYLCTCDSGLSYILQKINKVVFQNPVELMENIEGVTVFLAQKNDDPRASMHLIPTLEGKSYYLDGDGEYWRTYAFVTSSRCLQRAESDRDFYNSGLAFGRFQQQLAGFPVEKLHESIHDFHNTCTRYQQFKDALSRDPKGRAATCKEEIDFVFAREKDASAIVSLLADGSIPMRVTHNDTKLNNVLMDYDTMEPLCVIDLDTVMPGSVLYDYGDSIRFGASTAAEDEQDLSKVSMDLGLFRCFTEGFLLGCGGSLTEKEVEMLPMGAKLMTLECGVRFLTDHLNGDVYFRIHRENHNLDRARTQFKLVADMENKWEEMHRIVKEVLK